MTKAREKAAEHRKLAQAGIDPLEERRKVQVVIPTFEDEGAKLTLKDPVNDRQPSKDRFRLLNVGNVSGACRRDAHIEVATLRRASAILPSLLRASHRC